MEMHLEQEIRSLWKRHRQSFRQENGSCADGPSSQATRIALSRGDAHGPHSAEARFPVHAFEPRGGARGDISEERMMRGLARAGTKFDRADPFILFEMERNGEIAEDIRTAGRQLEGDRHLQNQ